MWIAGIISSIKEWAQKLTLKDILWISSVVFLLLFLRQCNATQKLKTDLALEEQNRIAMTDSLEIIKDEHNNLVAFKTTVVADEKRLKDINVELSNEIKRLKNRGVRGKIQTVSRINGGIGIDGPQVVEAEVVYINAEGDVRLSLAYDTIYDQYNSRHLKGYVDFYIDSMKVSNVRAMLTEDQINIALSTGLVKDDDGVYKIYVQSDYPGFTVSKIDGAILEPKMLKELGLTEDQWIIGPHVGYGWGYGADGASPFVGVGVTYNLNKTVKGIFR